jgi:hypothetical protein
MAVHDRISETRFWLGLLGLLVWPYFLGSHFTGI